MKFPKRRLRDYGASGAWIKWDAEEDSKRLDDRTAKVLALGERVLREGRDHTPMLPIDKAAARCKRGTGFVAVWDDDADLLAALEADRAAG